MTIILNEPLKDSTTYTFNFTEAVKDLTEGNAAENLVVAFSTGDYLDSLMVLGRVEDLLTRAPVEKCIVAIFEISDTLDIFLGTPKYFTKTDEQGRFKIEYLKNENFRIYAFVDHNRNLTAQSSSEKHGFLIDLVEPQAVYDTTFQKILPIVN